MGRQEMEYVEGLLNGEEGDATALATPLGAGPAEGQDVVDVDRLINGL